jgi:nucleoside-diphosphate-sugar epimerase
MRVLITGSGGRVGRAIVALLESTGHRVGSDVVTLDRARDSGAMYIGEVDDAALLSRACAGVEAIVHVAALHAPHVGVESDAEFERINVAGTQRVIDAARDAGVRRIVFTSSTAVYGHASTPTGRAGWVDESLTPQPRTIYHRSKLAAESLLRDAADGGGPDVRILRMSRCFPEPAPLMAAYRLHRGIDARDVATAHVLALDHVGGPHATWIVSSSPPFERGDVEALWHDAPAVLARRAPDLVAAFATRCWPLPRRIDRVYDPSAALRELNWRARFGFDDVLAQFDAGSREILAPPRT